MAFTLRLRTKVMQPDKNQSLLNVLAKNSIYLIFLLICLGYFLFRLYFFLVPIENTTLFLKKEHCGLVNLAEQPKNNCFIKGSVRQDLFGHNYIFKSESGVELYLNESIVEARMWEVKD